MKMILSPAKKMNNADHCGSFGQNYFGNWKEYDCEHAGIVGKPIYLEQTEDILSWLKNNSYAELMDLWKCNDKIAKQNVERMEDMDLHSCLTPALLSYEGIAFQYMAPAVFETEQYDYLQEHLRILSAFYGVLKPMDGVTPYRLEMGAKASIGNAKNLYDLWGDRLYRAVRDESGIIINLASKEYSKCVEKYLSPEDRYLTISFVEMSKGKLVTKGTYAKMARGEMVRFMAENKIELPEDLCKFDRLGYRFRDDLSDDAEFVFERFTEQK